MSTLFPRAITGERLVLDKVRTDYIVTGVEPISTMGSLQPYSGRDIDSLDILRRDMGVLEIFCDTPLRVSAQGDADQRRGDVIFWSEGRWEVFKEMAWDNGLIPHYNYLAQYIGAIA